MRIGILGSGLMGGALGTVFAHLIGHLAYEGDEGPEVAYRFERFRA